MAGGPHINILTSLAGAGQCSLRVRALIKPDPPVQSFEGTYTLTLSSSSSSSSSSPSTTTTPYLINHEMNSKTIRILWCQFFELLVKQNVAFRQISENQGHFSSILSVPQNGPDDLHDRGDSCAPSNHSQFSGHVSGVYESAFGALETGLFAHFQGVQVARRVAFSVRFNKQLKVATSIIQSDGRVWTDHFFFIPNSRQLNVLKKSKAKQNKI